MDKMRKFFSIVNNEADSSVKKKVQERDRGLRQGLIFRVSHVGNEKRKQSVRENKCVGMLTSETTLGPQQVLNLCWLESQVG